MNRNTLRNRQAVSPATSARKPPSPGLTYGYLAVASWHRFNHKRVSLVLPNRHQNKQIRARIPRAANLLASPEPPNAAATAAA